jgi:hypothetical protein
MVGAATAVATALHVGGTVGQILQGYDQNSASNRARCTPVCGVLPDGAVLTALRVEVENATHHAMEPCTPGTVCSAGFSRVLPQYQTQNLICVVISNWSGDQSRKVKMSYWFKSAIPPVEIR